MSFAMVANLTMSAPAPWQRCGQRRWRDVGVAQPGASLAGMRQQVPMSSISTSCLSQSHSCPPLFCSLATTIATHSRTSTKSRSSSSLAVFS